MQSIWEFSVRSKKIWEFSGRQKAQKTEKEFRSKVDLEDKIA